jgi:hypothetical protein
MLISQKTFGCFPSPQKKIADVLEVGIRIFTVNFKVSWVANMFCFQLVKMDNPSCIIPSVSYNEGVGCCGKCTEARSCESCDRTRPKVLCHACLGADNCKNSKQYIGIECEWLWLEYVCVHSTTTLTLPGHIITYVIVGICGL